LLTHPIDETKLTTLKGNTHPLARAQFDQGAAPSDLPMERMWLVLKRSPDQEAALRKLLDDQQDKTSPSYHKWLTPEQFGQHFGPADSDIQVVTSWLQTHGFQVAPVSKGRTVIEFSGTADLVRQAFHTDIHKFVVNGESHWANAKDPQIPEALTPAVAGVFTLHNFLKAPQIRMSEQKVPAKYEKGKPPQLTFSDGEHALAPGDYSVIYNSKPLLAQGITGDSATIAVVARSDLFRGGQDVIDFRNVFQVCCGNPNIIFNGDDPGDLGGGEEAEVTLDTTWAGAIAPNALVYVVVSASTNTEDGVDLSELYIIDNNLASIMTESFGACEQVIGSAQLAELSALAEQAAAQGITYMVSSGDSGAAGCDDPNVVPATHAAGINGLGSSPFTLTIGGTQFNEGSQPGTYWSSSNGSDFSSAKSYIPENAWNESSPSNGLWSTGGGRSIFFPKPSWQTGVPGIPADGARDVPDVSLTAAGHDGYLLCFEGSCVPDNQGFIQLYLIGGTSASSPSFAGVMALVKQKTGSRQGQAAYVLYRLAAAQNYSQCNGSGGKPNSSCVFNDTTVGNNSVPGLTGFTTTAGFDLATGLGSVNIANLVNKWNTVTFSPTTTTLSLNPTMLTHGDPVTVNITVTPNSGSGTPTGDVALKQDSFACPDSGRLIDNFTLTGGSVNTSTNLLPGGAYYVNAYYAGDKTYAPSCSADLFVNVQPESSTSTLSVFALDSSGNLIPFSSEPYGSAAYLRADVQSSSGYGVPSGYVNFSDDVGILQQSTLNSKGTAATAQGVWNIPAGAHNVKADYSGDSSFNPSTSSPVNITVTKAPTTLTLQDGFVSPGPEFLSATIATHGAGNGPSGTVTFFADGKQLGDPAPVNGTPGSGNIQTGAFTAAFAEAGSSWDVPPQCRKHHGYLQW
jgi:subtilase family serine protease